jgi:hypothetical protein
MTTKTKTTATKAASSRNEEGFSQLFVEASPRIEDPRELQTILNFSLRDLFGLCEPYSNSGLQVRRYRSPDDDNGNGVLVIARDGSKQSSGSRTNSNNGDDNKNHHLLVIQCPTASVPLIQAALTFVSPPPYLDDTTYRLDVVEIRRR